MHLKLYKNLSNQSVTIFVILFFLSQLSEAQPTQLNDGRIRLRVWLHKVWTNANCDDLGGQEYVYRGIRVRPTTDITGIGWSPSGVNVRADGEENRWWSRTQWTGLQLPAGSSTWPMTQDANGVMLLDVTYSSTSAPTTFDWSVAEMWEDDDTNCIWPCDGGTSNWTYNPSFCCGLLGDDNYVGYIQSSVVNPFRGGPNGQVHYVQSDVLGGGEQQSYSILFAFQWDWVDPLPSLPTLSTNQSSGGIEYQDGPLTLEVQLMGIWSDSDYDWGINCVFGVADNEDLRVRWRSRDNLAGFVGGSTCINSLSQPYPQWNTGNPITSLLTRNYTALQTNFKEFEIEFELWEEDCNGDCTYDASGCLFGLGNDDNYYYGTTGLVNWRNSIPTLQGQANIWNYLDFPLRAGSTSYNNWSAWIRYRWVQAAPTVTIVAPKDRTLCIGTATTLSVNATNATFYQWQVTDVTGDDDGDGNGFVGCPTNATWTDIAGAYWKDYTPPQTAGTRLYRCVISNRTGSGSYTTSGPRLNTVYSDCFRVTYFPYAPSIISNACGSSIVGGVAYSFTFPIVPAIGAVANASSYTWSVSPSAGVTISNPTGTTTNITFPPPSGTQSYTVYLTVGDICPAVNSFSTCTVTATSDYCGFVYVATTGSDVNIGSPTDRKSVV